MNKQIQELIKQCTTYYNGGLGTEIEVFDKEKFAQLIVQECATLTLDHRSDGYYRGWLDYRDEIRRHFGVEG
jgi:hypothetical protein